MSRINRYQESMDRFMKKSCINELLDDDIKNNIQNIISKNDHFESILLLTILNSQCKKNDAKMHGYYVASSIEIISTITKLLDNGNRYFKNYDGSIIKKNIPELIGLINMGLTQNMESLVPYYKGDEIIKLLVLCSKLININIGKILADNEMVTNDNIKSTDVVKYKFNNMSQIKNKLSSLLKVDQNDLVKFINDKYGCSCKIAAILGWLVGYKRVSNQTIEKTFEKTMPILEKIGESFGFMIKLSNDFVFLENDITNADTYSKNYLVNYGFQNGFECFLENKQKFIEGCIQLDVYTHTVKEMIDIIENNIDEVINNSVPDLRSSCTLT